MTRKEINENPEKSPRTNELLDQYRNGDDKNVYDVFALAKSLEEELGQLRALFPQILDAADNGSGCMATCSVEFMSWIPKEIKSVVQNLKFRLTTYRRIAKDSVEMLEKMISDRTLPSEYYSQAQRTVDAFDQYKQDK